MIETSLRQAQRFILETQSLISKKPVKSVMSTVKKIHNVQIDTISVVARSHDLILYNRVTEYEEGDVWKYLKNGKLFEYWSHGMCLIPINQYPFYAWRMKRYRESKKAWLKGWASKNKEVINDVHKHIKKKGATPSKQLGKRESKGGGWWDWKAEKLALEYLFYSGELMISHREGFQKFYDLTERVLPATIDSEPLHVDEIPLFTVNTILSSLGIASALDIKKYLGTNVCPQWGGRVTNIEKYLDELITNNEVEEITINGVDQRYFVSHKNRRRLNQTENSNCSESSVKLLSPFDNVIRERHRPLSLWKFDYKIEAYVPAPKRKYGYFVLPILDGCQIVGRLDPKIHRKDGVFEIKALYLEGDLWKDDERIERLSNGLIEFSKFHECNSIELGKITPKKMKPAVETSIESLF